MTSKNKQAACRHCGTPVKDSETFCCRGCEYVHHLIHDEGLDRYYDLKDRQLSPIGSTAFLQRDDEALVGEWEQADEVSPGVRSQPFELKGISCVGCVWLVEKLFSRYAGSIRIDIDPQIGKIQLDARREFDLSGFAGELQRFGYTLNPWQGGTEEGSDKMGSRIGICGFLALNVMGFTLPFYLGMDSTDPLAPLLRFLVMVLSTFSVFVGGTYFIRRAWTALRLGVLHIDLPIALGILAAYAGSVTGWVIHAENLLYFDFIALFIVLMLMGRWLQERVTDRNIRKGRGVNPESRKLRLVGVEHSSVNAEIPLRQIRSCMRYRLKAGDWVPTRSRVTGGSASCSLESISGEADPRIFAEGETLPAGAIVLNREELELESLEDWQQSLLKRLFEIQVSERSGNSLMGRILSVYISIVLALAAIGFAVWTFGIGSWITGFQVAVSILVVSCPCAIGLAYPRVNDLCAQWLQGRGVYIRLHSLWGRLKRIRTVFFDKTGTLTLETLDIANPDTLKSLTPDQTVALYGLVNRNLHPVARSIKEYLLTLEPSLSKKGAELPDPMERIGYGVEFRWLGRTFSLLKSTNTDWIGQTEFREQDKLVAVFQFNETVRNDVIQSIRWLEKNHFSVAVISGDSPQKVSQMMTSLGLPQDRGVGGMSPEEKAEWIEKHARSQGMMVGDGANDALAFEKALCRATPVIGRGVLENHSDFFFLGRGIQGVIDVFRLHPRRQRVVGEIFTLTVVYNVVTVGVCLMGWMNPLLAAVLMPISSIVTVSWASVRLSGKLLDRTLVRED